MSVSRLQLFEGIVDALGEKIEARATSVGTATTFISADLYFPDNDLRGREVWYAESNHATSAANEGTRNFVSSNSEANRRLTVANAWPAEPQIGDRIVLANARGWSATIPEIHDKINDLLREVGEEMATEVAAASATFNSLSPTVTYSADWDWFLGAQWYDWDNRWKDVPPQDYELSPWDGTVTVKNRTRRLAHGRAIRLIGATNLALLDDDDDTTTVDYGWFRFQAAAELRRQTAIRWGDTVTAYTDSQLLQAEADKRRARVGKRYTPIGRRVRLRQ